MKKIIIVAALVCTTGALASRVKINNTPKVTEKAAIHASFSADSKELASGD